MTLQEYVRAAFGVVEPRLRRKFILAVLALAAVSVLDLIALMFVIAMTSLGTSSSSTDQDRLAVLPEALLTPLARVGLDSLAAVATTLGLAIVVLFIGKAFLAASVIRRVLRSLARQEAEATNRLMMRLMRAPLVFHLSRKRLEMMTDVTVGMEALVMKTIAPAILIAAELVLMMMLGVGLVVLAPVVAIGSLAYFSAVLWILHKWIGRRASAAGRADADSTRQGMNIIHVALAGFREIVTRGVAEHFVNDLHDVRLAGTKARTEVAYLGLLPRYFLESALVLGMAFCFAVQLPFTDFAGALAGLALFAVVGFRLLPSLQRVQASAALIKTWQAVGERTLTLIEDLDADPASTYSAASSEEQSTGSQVRSTSVRGLTLDGVSFSYAGSASSALADVSAHFPAEQMTAVVGASGSGKSTMVDVLLGLLAPGRGRVLLDGSDIRGSMDVWRRMVGYVPQESFLMPTSIRENVAFGVDHADIDDASVWAALDRAALTDVVERLPQALDFQLGDGGSGLSGGQRQRLGIARALYHNPRVLILDEATSALDVETEAEITQTLSTLSGLTKIVVAHRLSTVREAHQVLFLRAGVLEASGSFEEVREGVPDFARQVHLSGLVSNERGSMNAELT